MADLLVNNPNWQSFASGLEQDRGLHPGLLAGIMKNETAGGHPDIINRTSTAGAQGAFQFMPQTAQQYNVNVADAADSTRGAADFLGDLTKKYNDPLLAAAAYNWGPGNVDRAMKAASGAGLPTDALSLANHGFLPHETSAYVSKLASNLQQSTDSGPTQYSPDVINSTRSAVINMVRQGSSPVAIVQALGNSPVKEMVNTLVNQGTSPADIVTQIGGAQLQKDRDAQAKINEQGFGTNLVKGASNAVSDLATGAKQLGATLTGDDATLKQLNAEQAAKENDPEYRAQQDTVGSTISGLAVKSIPYFGAAALTDGASLIPSLLVGGAAGATSGALKPTTGDGQRLSNILMESAGGALGGAGGALLSKGPGAVASKLLRSPSQAADATALKAAADAQGLPVNAATLSTQGGFWRNVADSMPNNGSVRGFQDKADQVIAGKVANELGIPGYTGPIDHDMLEAARPVIGAGLDNARNVSVVLPQSFKTELQTVVTNASDPLLEGLTNNATVKQAVANITREIDAGLPVSGARLQLINTALKEYMQSAVPTGTEKQAAGQLIGKITKTLTDQMTPDQAAAYSTANSQYASLKAAEKMVTASNDTGVVMPRQMLQAVKTGRFRNAFLQGEAPFQSLAGTASDLYGPASGKGLGSVLAKALGSDHSLMAAAVLEPHTGLSIIAAKKLASMLAAKLATSENPTVIRLLTGAGGKAMDPTMKAYIAKALSGATSATGGLGSRLINTSDQ